MEQRNAVADAIAIKDNKIALVKRKYEPFKGFYALPGGYVDVGETTKEAALRELKEETNLSGQIDYLVGFYDDPNRDPRQNVTFAYVIQAEGELKAADDAEQAAWFDLDKLPPLAFDHKQIIEDFLAGYNLVRQRK
jgi:8-oxo-dGTP diphosphatase